MKMLSSPASTTPSHQRTQSNVTMTGMGMEAPYTQDTNNRQQFNVHYRGLSLDQSMDIQGKVSTTTGFNQQHTLRETQTQDPTRPGHHGLPAHSHSFDANDPAAQFRHAGLPDFITETWPLDMVHQGKPALGPPSGARVASPAMQDEVVARGAPKSESAQYVMHTPKKQSVASVFPLTPVTGSRHAHCRSFTPSMALDDDVFELPRTPEVTPMKRSSSHQEASMKRPPSSGSDTPATPNTAPMPCAPTFDFEHVSTAALLDVSNLNIDYSGCGGGYDSSNYSPMTCRTSPTMTSMQSSPELGPVSLFGNAGDGHVPYLPAAQQDSGCQSPTSPRGHSPKKKSLQMPDDMIIAETGISNEEVEAFIQGPDPATKEYTCLFDGCKFKPFARKENIRSHVQTHLGDRKFVCGTCRARFVRPNDLKRHAVIHQPARDFVCVCGAAFGRKDALRRHKLRNERCARDEPDLQVVKREEKKRGRPRKVAPTETAERRERKERIRRQVMSKKGREGSVPSSVATSYPSPGAEGISSPEPQSAAHPSHLAHAMVQEYSPTMEMAFTPPASPEDVVINPCLMLQQPPQFSGSPENLSPPPTRGSLTAHLGSVAAFNAPKPSVETINLQAADDFGAEAFGLPMAKPISHASSCGSPPDLDQLSSSPEPSYLKPTVDGFGAFGQSMVDKASSFDDFDFGPARSGADDMFELFGDQPSMNVFEKHDNGLAGLNANHGEDSIW